MRKIQQQEPQKVLTVLIKPVSGQLDATQEENKAQAKIPRDYQKFYAMFKEEAHEKLPKHCDWDHEILIEKGKKPTYRLIYALSESVLKALREYLDENLKKGFIQPFTSLAGYPSLFVPKKDKKLQLCVDYRQLNAITVTNHYPLPLISELQDRIQGSQWLTALNIRRAFNLVQMKEGEEWKTAFQTRYGHYKYTVMPFGLTNAPATFQALINTTLCKYLDIFVTAYLDDILIYTKDTLKKHIQAVKKVFKALQKANIRLQPDKCKFHVKTVKFFGSIITIDGIQMDNKKVKAIREWPEPRNLKEVQAFLGFANFYRRFIQRYSQICTPLTKMTKKEQPFHWECEQREAFEKLKKKFTLAPILASFDPERKIIFKTGASDQALGSCLSQPDAEKQLHPVAYRSRKFSGPELNYDIHNKELLAIVDAFEE